MKSPRAQSAAQKQIDKRIVRDRESDAFDDVAIRFIERDQKQKGKRCWKETARLLGLRETEDGELATIPDGIVARWRSRQIQDITKRDVIDCLDRIVDRGAGVLANRTLAAIRRLFNWCLEKDILTVSPAARVKAPTDETSRERVLSDDEIRLFWNACGKVGFPFGDAAKMLLLTGQRRSEVSGMTRDEIKFDVWTIPRERTKNKRSHQVPLSRSALAVLKSAPDTGNFIFLIRGDAPIQGWSLAKTEIDELMLEAAGEKAKIEPWRLHDLRRTVASGMARIGVPLPVIEKCLNHASGSFAGIVGVYQRHTFEAEMRQAFEDWAATVEKIASGKPASVIRMRRA